MLNIFYILLLKQNSILFTSFMKFQNNTFGIMQNTVYLI